MGQRAWGAARWRAMLSGVSHRGLAAGSALLAGQVPAGAASRGPLESLGFPGSFDPHGAMQAAAMPRSP